MARSLLCLAFLGLVLQINGAPPIPERQHMDVDFSHLEGTHIVTVKNGTSGYTSGDLNDGHWYCPWYLGLFECADGEFTCDCPGGGTAKFSIGCCYHFPECGRICNDNDCSRYANCDSCKGFVSGSDNNVCYSCKPGFALGSGDCQTDIDECISANGGCEQNCHNTHGSYYCSCDDGFQLEEDKHSCLRLNCGAPAEIDNGQVSPTADWLFDSYAEYKCTNPRYHLVGNNLRECLGSGASVWWAGSDPSCIAACEDASVVNQPTCGNTGVSEDTCLQLGCCFREGQCYKSPVRTYIRYGNVRPEGYEHGIHTYDQYSPDGCAYQCDIGNPDCEHYGVKRLGYDEVHDVTQQSCHLLPSIGEDVNWVSDENYDFYQAIRATLLISHGNIKSSYSEQLTRILGKLYEGCYADSASDHDLPHQVAHNKDLMTASSCMAICRHHAYIYAAVQNGVDCYCGNSQVRKHGQSENCKTSCPGDSSQNCGGPQANAIYHVSMDHRYAGCYLDNTADRDLPVLKGGPMPAHECADLCMKDGHKFAGIQDGGICYCGDTYGKHGAAGEYECKMSCDGWGMLNCGGNNVNAIYLAEPAYSMQNLPSEDFTAAKLYDTTGSVTGISTTLFTVYSGLRSFISKKLTIYAHEGVETLSEAPVCADDCYEACGNIQNEQHYGNLGEDVILRFFFFRLSDLPSYVGSNPKRVYIYAQTVIIDYDVDANFALLIYARQILLDRLSSTYISVSTSEELDLDVDYAKLYGPYPDLTHQKQAFMCARILFDTKEQYSINTGFAVLRGVCSAAREDAEQAAYAGMVCSYIGEMSGITKADIHFIPLYTKSHMKEVLETYYSQISVYKEDLDRLADSNTAVADFIHYAEEMHTIYINTDLVEAQGAFDEAIRAVGIANATYSRMRLYYNLSMDELDVARLEFEEGIRQAKLEEIKQSLFNFVLGVGTAVVGGVTSNPGQIVSGIGTVFSGTDGLGDILEDLAMVIDQVEDLTKTADENMKRLEDLSEEYDETKYIQDVEMMASLAEMSVRWDNLKFFADLILADPRVLEVGGSAYYSRAIMDLSNWGKALTDSMVERAETTREAMEKRKMLDSKKEQAIRVQALINAMKDDFSLREEVLAAMHEETYDVRVDLNEALLAFCQAYFYETLEECSSDVKPSFGGALSDLLIKINRASEDSLLDEDIPSTVSRIISIKDTNTDPECADATACPINYFRKHKMLYFPLATDHQELIDLQKYRVGEMRLEVIGAKPSADNEWLQLRIESTGEFQGRAFDNVYNFLSRPLTNKAYEYSLNTGHISVYADIYDPLKGVFHHLTPYTLWMIYVYNPRSGDIDVSDVTEIRMNLRGYGLVARHQDNKDNDGSQDQKDKINISHDTPVKENNSHVKKTNKAVSSNSNNNVLKDTPHNAQVEGKAHKMGTLPIRPVRPYGMSNHPKITPHDHKGAKPAPQF